MASGYSAAARRLGIVSAIVTAALIVLYAATLVIGFMSLKSPDDQIGDPMFTILEVLILVLMPAMVALMVALHAWAPAPLRVLSFVAVIFMGLLALVTSCVHFLVLTLSRSATFVAQPSAALFLSFRWPSVAYALDILALVGLSGVIVGEMQLRNIGILGYVGGFLLVAVMLARLFYRTVPREA